MSMNHHDPYLLTVFGFMGITDITFIHVENDEYGGHKLASRCFADTARVANARNKITELIADKVM
jgi:FMN-dependent NADH-azoreductase